jgi:hypothetical protein
MAVVRGCGSILAATILIAACSGPSSPIPSASQRAAPSPATFSSTNYGYTVSLPAGWTSVQASKAWDGSQGVSDLAPTSDQFLGPTNENFKSWAVAAPSRETLAAYTDAVVAATTRYHGDTCPPKPAAREPITIGGAAGTLLSYNCGVLINLAATVHHGVGYQFGLRDQAVIAATDPADRALFLAILQSVRFPG